MTAVKEGDVLGKDFVTGIACNGFKGRVYILNIAADICNYNCFGGVFDNCNQPCRV